MMAVLKYNENTSVYFSQVSHVFHLNICNEYFMRQNSYVLVFELTIHKFITSIESLLEMEEKADY